MWVHSYIGAEPLFYLLSSKRHSITRKEYFEKAYYISYDAIYSNVLNARPLYCIHDASAMFTPPITGMRRRPLFPPGHLPCPPPVGFHPPEIVEKLNFVFFPPLQTSHSIVSFINPTFELKSICIAHYLRILSFSLFLKVQYKFNS